MRVTTNDTPKHLVEGDVVGEKEGNAVGETVGDADGGEVNSQSENCLVSS